MKIKKRSKIIHQNKSLKLKKFYQRKHLLNIISANEVTERSLQIWRELPSTIRKDPILATFQLQHDRSHKGLPNDELISDGEGSADDDDVSQIINMKISEQIDGNLMPPSNDLILSGYQQKTYRRKSLSFRTFGIQNLAKPQTAIIEKLPISGPDFKKYAKIGFLLLAWLIGASSLATYKQEGVLEKQLVIPNNGAKYFLLFDSPTGRYFTVNLKGPFLNREFNYYATKDYLYIQVQIVKFSTGTVVYTLDDTWYVPTAAPQSTDMSSLNLTSRKFDLTAQELQLFLSNTDYRLRLNMTISNKKVFAFRFAYNPMPMNTTLGTIYAGGILILLYVLIIWEIVHRTFAAIICAILSVGIISALGDRPTMSDILTWMDIETIMLLFCMMILVAILSETGVFDCLAVGIFKISKGRIWPLIHCLCVVTCFISAVLNNVTTILLMTPITIKLCEIMHLDPVPVLMGIIIPANVSGALTPIGDTSNVLITTNHYVSQDGVTFFTFIEHMILGVLLVSVQSCIQLRFTFRDIQALRLKEPKQIRQLHREIIVWQRSAAALSSYLKDVDLVREILLQKVKILKDKLHKLKLEGTFCNKGYQETLEELTAANPIKNKPLLIKSCFAMVFIVGLFCAQSVPNFQRLSLSWSALLGVILLCIIAEKDDMHALMVRMEWATLIFFSAMFVTMESLQRLGLISWIGGLTENIILSVPLEHRLAMAIFLILWVSALTSAFVDSIMITAMMLKVVISLAANRNLGLPLQPLVWALAFGPCLGGNGTLYGSSASVVCAGIVEQHGYDLNFSRFFKIGFPMMIGSTIVITGYLMIAHVLFSWH